MTALPEKRKARGLLTGPGPFCLFCSRFECVVLCRRAGAAALYPRMQTESRSLGKWFSASPVPSALTATMFSILTPNLPGR